MLDLGSAGAAPKLVVKKVFMLVWFKKGGWLVLLLFLISCGPAVPAVVPLPQPTKPAPTAAATSPPPPSPLTTPELFPTLPVAFLPTAETPAKDNNLANLAWQIGLGNTGAWLYETGSFIHPRALEVIGEVAYLLDSGRVLRLDLRHPTAPEVVLQAGVIIDGVPVIEPFDLSSEGDMLYVLDRAGDVYRYNTAAGLWRLDRYDRAVREVSSQYYVGIAAAADTRFLLETSYHFVQAYTTQGDSYAWLTDGAREIDLSVADGFAYVLTQANPDVGQITKVEAALRRQVEWQLDGVLMRPRHIQTTSSTLTILDQAGYRLQTFDPTTGTFQHVWNFTQPISAFWNDGQRLILAAQDTLYFVGQPEKQAVISGGVPLADHLPHDPQVLASLEGLVIPVLNTTVAGREFQLPGAPRHYRLGVHEGMDFYKAIGTPVLAVAGGVVIRADTTYITPTERLFGEMRETVMASGYTPEEVLDFYRGRQIWLQLDNGWVARYAHLSAIAPDIAEGTRVTAGQIIGQVGNSGSPITQQNPEGDVHLHFELWLGEHYLGQFLHPIEVLEWLGIIFSEQ